MSDRATVHARVADAGLDSDRYIDVENGSKASYQHDRRFDDPPTGNYGVYATPRDGLVLLDIDDHEEIADTSGLTRVITDLPATFEQESAHGGRHLFYRVRPDDNGRLVAAVLDEVLGTSNPGPSWGEVRVANQYVVGAGSQLDGCDKDWCDACAGDGGGYSVAEDREIATISAQRLVEVLLADPRLSRDDVEPGTPDDADGTDPLSEDSVEERLRIGREQDDKLDRLMDGDYSDYNGDRSRAEAALAAKLGFWVGRDKQQVANVLDRHARAPKWSERDDESYRQSVLSAVDLGTDEFDPSVRQSDHEERTAAAEARDTVESDGGVTTAENAAAGDATVESSLGDRVKYQVLQPLDPPEDWDGEQIDEQVAIDRFARLLTDEHSYVRPREDVRGWRDTLYVYVDGSGIYEPHGETQIREQTERLLGSVVGNQFVREVVGKVERLSFARPGSLKCEPNRLVVANGIVDLHNGELTAHTPEEYHRTRIDVDYDPEADCPRIKEFFGEIVNGNDIDTLFRLAAHSLYKEYIAEKAAMLLGDGQNGKSVFLSLLREFLGEFNVSQRALQDFDDNNFAAKDLEGKLANLHPDMGDEMVRDLDVFKQLTGRDVMTADVKYEKPIKFENHATLVFAANRMPAMGEDTHALWRRWVYVNFPYTFRADDPDAKDPTPKRKLMRELTADSELQGLLARCVEEISAWHDGREFFPGTLGAESVREKMKRASEPVYDFVHACLETTEDDDAALPKEDVRQAYQEYAREENLPAMSPNAFGEKLLNIRDFPIDDGQQRDGGQRKRVYQGVEWSARGRQLMGLDDPEDDGQDQLDGDHGQRETVVIQAMRDLENDWPVTKPMLLGRLTGRLSLSNARAVVDKMVEEGRLKKTPDGLTL